MDDMNLYDRFHAAFDIAPPAGGFDRLHRELSNYRPDRRGRPAFPKRWNRMGIRFAAAIAVVVIAITMAAAYLASHRGLTGGVPASSVADYQALVQRDYNNWNSTPITCRAIEDPTCPADISRHSAIEAKYLSDLVHVQAPPQFAVIDPQLRLHLRDLIQKLDTANSAVGSGNKPLFDNATYYATIDVTWLTRVALGIAKSQVVSSSQYTALMQAEYTNLTSDCSVCQSEAVLADCATIDDPLCAHDLVTDADFIGSMQADFAATVAPSEFRDQSTTLQIDLAQADDALVAMNNALLAGNQVALQSARSAFLDASSAVVSDLQS